VAIDEAGAISGMLVKPVEGAGPPVAKSQIPLGLPFRGTWSVVWGGDTPALNHHVDSPSQRRAADLVVVDDAGATHKGDGRDNRDYFAYGKEVIAVADGVVVTAVDGVPDNQPGEMNTMFVPGNLIVIEHAGGVWSAYAHLVPGSLAVKVGAKVRRGQLLGRCGNSGNSSEPHLHFQVEDGPRFEKSWGIEPVFAAVEVTRDGVRERPETYTWRKGDQVHAP
jgi:murein DD-endopeptidase MepM/ murein hydrolase activator NlpD